MLDRKAFEERVERIRAKAASSASAMAQVAAAPASLDRTLIIDNNPKNRSVAIPTILILVLFIAAAKTWEVYGMEKTADLIQSQISRSDAPLDPHS
tara:strand:- start:63 stop:350 length:288 start_codon:yes stop_codon:yes gene_type:complete